MGERFCTACGHQLQVGDRFCTACGMAVSSAVLAPAAATPPPAPVAAVPAAVRRRRGAGWWLAVLIPLALVVAAASFALGLLTTHRDDRQPASAPPAASSAPADTPTVSPTVSAAPDPAALTQAGALRRLLTDSADDKRAIAAAAAQLNGCAHLNRAVRAFADAAHSRDVLVARARDLQIGLLPGGGQAVASLTRALQASARADQAYVDWGRSLHRGAGQHHRCRGDDALRARATRLSSQSHAPKQAAADAWNVIAAQFGLPTIHWSSL